MYTIGLTVIIDDGFFPVYFFGCKYLSVAKDRYRVEKKLGSELAKLDTSIG